MKFKGLLLKSKKFICYFGYSCRKDRLVKSIFSKDKINVVFFAVNVGMWKSDGLFRLLLTDKRFNPVIVSFLLKQNSNEYKKRVQDEMRDFFTNKGYPYYDSYDFEKNEWFDIRTLSPDIVLYAQQGNYNSSYKEYRLESLWHNALFAYVPYCLLMEKLPSFFNGLLTGISWRVFAPTTIHKDMYSKYSLARGENTVVSGCTFADDILQQVDDCWKIKDNKLKRIIWAPHHSILPTDALNYSNFLEVAEPMLELAKKYADKVQFAFKPHPRLLDKLYKLDNWGVKKADSYYQQWAQLPNTMYVSGNYVSLFKYSDAMIHDCSSFTGEYLFTHKPVMYLTKADHLDFMNEFGRLCFEQHYKGSSISDVEAFIQNVVIGGDDFMRTNREQFYKNYLQPPHGRNVAQNMYFEFTREISNHACKA